MAPLPPAWPPEPPPFEVAHSVAEATMEKTKRILLREELSRRERRMIRQMDTSTTNLSIAIPLEGPESLQVTLEIMHATRVRAGRLLLGEGELSFLIPCAFVHRAINSLRIHQAHALADTLIYECVEALKERHAALSQTIRAEDHRSMEAIHPHRYDAELVELHEAIRSGTLPEGFSSEE